MIKLNKDGFSLIEGLLVLLIIVSIGAVGWYVFGQRKSPATKTDNAQTAPTANNETSTWIEYSPADKSYSMKLPDGWKFYDFTVNGAAISTDNKPLTLKQGERAEVLKQKSPTPENGFDRLTLVVGDDHTRGFTTTKSTCEDGTFTEFAIPGIKGTKETTVQESEPTIEGAPKGTKTYTYCFFSKSYNFTASYIILPGETDQSAVLEKALQTLKLK